MQSESKDARLAKEEWPLIHESSWERVGVMVGNPGSALHCQVEHHVRTKEIYCF
jgi:hypothetical protein